MVTYGMKSLFATFFLSKFLIANGIVVTPENPKKNEMVILTANTTGLNTITWQKDGKPLTSCYVGPGACGAPNILSGAIIAIDKTTDETTITIASANQSYHGGIYGARSTNVELIINTLPTIMNWTEQPRENLTDSSATWTAKIYCVYPTSLVNVEFTVYVEGIKDVSSRSVALSNETDPSCDAPEQTIVASLTLSSSEFRNKKVYIIGNASHAYFPNEPKVTSGQSVETTFQGDHISTSVPITKPPPREICFHGNGCPIGTTLVIVIPIVAVVLITFCLIYLCRIKTKSKNNNKSKRQTNNSEDPFPSADSVDMDTTIANQTNTSGANRIYNNQSRSTHHDKKSKYSTYDDKKVEDSPLSTKNMKQKESVLNDDHNNGSKNIKKDESANRSEGDKIKSTYAVKQPKFGVSNNKLHELTCSANNTKQEGSVFNNEQNNCSKNEKEDNSEKGSDDEPSVTTSAGIHSQSGAREKTLLQLSVSTNKKNHD